MLSESVKSLEERVKQKTSELTETQERYECVCVREGGRERGVVVRGETLCLESPIQSND